MTTDKSSVRILIYNDCSIEKFLNVFFPVFWRVYMIKCKLYLNASASYKNLLSNLKSIIIILYI